MDIKVTQAFVDAYREGWRNIANEINESSAPDVGGVRTKTGILALTRLPEFQREMLTLLVANGEAFPLPKTIQDADDALDMLRAMRANLALIGGEDSLYGIREDIRHLAERLDQEQLLLLKGLLTKMTQRAGYEVPEPAKLYTPLGRTGRSADEGS